MGKAGLSSLASCPAPNSFPLTLLPRYLLPCCGPAEGTFSSSCTDGAAQPQTPSC